MLLSFQAQIYIHPTQTMKIETVEQDSLFLEQKGTPLHPSSNISQKNSWDALSADAKGRIVSCVFCFICIHFHLNKVSPYNISCCRVNVDEMNKKKQFSCNFQTGSPSSWQTKFSLTQRASHTQAVYLLLSGKKMCYVEIKAS